MVGMDGHATQFKDTQVRLGFVVLVLFVGTIMTTHTADQCSTGLVNGDNEIAIIAVIHHHLVVVVVLVLAVDGGGHCRLGGDGCWVSQINGSNLPHVVAQIPMHKLVHGLDCGTMKGPIGQEQGGHGGGPGPPIGMCRQGGEERREGRIVSSVGMRRAVSLCRDEW